MSSSTHAAGAETETANDRRAGIRDQALGELAETDASDETVKATVLRALYHHQHAVSLGDILELNTTVAVPDAGTLDERVGTVLTESIAEHDSWTASENTSGPATEGH